MEQGITFSGDSGRIVIKVLDYERATADNKDDANWLTSIIAVEVPPFAGSFRAAFTTHELAGLYGRLQVPLQSLSGTVSFQNLEEDLTLEIQFANRGAVRVSGIAQPRRSAGVALHFRFESDQSLIGRAVEELSSVLRHFPVRQIA